MTGLWNKFGAENLYSTIITRNDVDFIFCPITRCASQWISYRLIDINNFYTVVQNIGNTNEAFSDYDHKAKLFIVRDPLERMISGARTREDFSLEDFSLDKESLFNKLDEDIHTLPMSVWFKPFANLDNAVFIKFENWDKLDKFFAPYNLAPNETVSQDRWTGFNQWIPSDNSDSRISSPWYNYVISNPDILDNLKEYLDEDYKFLKTITYYR